MYKLDCYLFFSSGKRRKYLFTCSDVEDALNTSRALLKHASDVYGPSARLIITILPPNETD